MKFHPKCGDNISLLNNRCTAARNISEFNHAVVFSEAPLQDDVLFEVRIDKKLNVWNGGLEIGVTTLDPQFITIVPGTATKIQNTSWILSGASIVKDGVTCLNPYGPQLDTLREGDFLGVARSNQGELLFYANRRCLGVAATGLPPSLFAVLDLYGRCAQVSILDNDAMLSTPNTTTGQVAQSNNGINDGAGTSAAAAEAGAAAAAEAAAEAGAVAAPEGAAAAAPEAAAEGAAAARPDEAGALAVPTLATPILVPPTPAPIYGSVPGQYFVPIVPDAACALGEPDYLHFHTQCGYLIRLSENFRTAERVRPLEDYNNGVVMTHRPLHDNELFEVQIDQLVDKWSGSIEVGVTAHNPDLISFPTTMTNMEVGTIMLSGTKVLRNGHGVSFNYGNFNLDDLKEGESVGIMRKSNGKLHYFINGVDRGVAFPDVVEQHLWGVVDLYGMAVKATIMRPREVMDTDYPLNLTNAPDPLLSCKPHIDEHSLLFHTLRDSNVIIINDGKTAHRPNAFEVFVDGFVMTNRTLKANELFQVKLDLVIPKWTGSIEIGVTQQSSNDIQLPFRVSQAKSGTWAISGEDMIHDGAVIIPQYVKNLSKLVEGDTVGVMRTDAGTLHFYINGVDQGPAAHNVPEQVYGIIDLYGRVAQATICNTGILPLLPLLPALPVLPPMPVLPPDITPESPMPLSTESNATVYPEMCFHHVHGRNGRLSQNRMTASRNAVYSEFNDAVMFSSRPLRECEMFELRIDKMVDCWIGSLEIGVTAVSPDDLVSMSGAPAVAGTATDLEFDTYILSGAAMMNDGQCIRSGYCLDLDLLDVGTRVGMMWHADRTIHYYMDGMDMGKAWYVPHLNIYAVVDLYGQCTQVTLLKNEDRQFYGCTNSENSLLSNSRAMSPPSPHYCSFSEYCGHNIELKQDYSIACRLTVDPMSALVFSAMHLMVDELFEIKVVECKSGCAGSFRMGVTDVNILNANVNRHVPPAMSNLPHYTAYIDGRYMKFSRPDSLKERDVLSFVPSFEWIRPGDRVGLKRTSDSRVIIYYNSEPVGLAFTKVPEKVYAVMELFGQVTKIQALSRGSHAGTTSAPPPVPNEECVKAPVTIAPTPASVSASQAANMRSNIECNDDIPNYLLSYATNMSAESELDEAEFYELAFHELPFNQYPYDDSPVNRSPVNRRREDELESERLENDRLEYERSENDGSDYERSENDRSENERMEDRHAEDERIEDERIEDERIEDERIDDERIDDERIEDDRIEDGCIEDDHIEDERIDDERIEDDRIDDEIPIIEAADSPGPTNQFADIGEHLCDEQQYYDPPCYSSPSNGTPCNDISFSEPSDKDAPRNMPVIKESQYKPTDQSCFNAMLDKDDSLNDINDPLSSKTPPIEFLDDDDSPINDSPINDESSLNDLPFSDLSDNETHTNDPMAPEPTSPETMEPDPMIPEPMDPEPDFTEPMEVEPMIPEPMDPQEIDSELMFPELIEVDDYMNKSPPDCETPVDQMPDNDMALKSGLCEYPIYELPFDDYMIKEALVMELEFDEVPVDMAFISEALVSSPNTELTVMCPPINEPLSTEAKITEVVEDDQPLVTNNNTANFAASEGDTLPSTTTVAIDPRPQRPTLPYTFHYIHGKNIKLCSSDTVAVRTTGYKHGISIVSQPLRRGRNFRFRVDKVLGGWFGGASIGAVGSLPLDVLPSCALRLDPPIWIVSGEVLHDNGIMTRTRMATKLDELTQNSVLTVHFRFNSDILIEIDGEVLGSIGTVPRMYTHVYPLIDLYGRIQQVSVLLHPHVIVGGASLDLPIIAENHCEESLAELDLGDSEPTRTDFKNSLIIPEYLPKRNTKAHSHDNLLEEELIIAEPGPSSTSDPEPFETETSTNEIGSPKDIPDQISLHHSLIVSEKCKPGDHYKVVNRSLQKSQSTQSFRHVVDESLLPTEVKDALQHTLSAGSDICGGSGVIHGLFDTNIRHNDRYPEANDVDNLDNEIMDALTLETGNLPDLTEEQSSSFDDSTRRDDFWSESLAVENLHYLNRILCLDQDGAEGQSLESEWEATGENCEHLHLVLKYWNYLVLPYPELRRAVSWGQVRCYCSKCQPDATDALAGWVRIERIDGVGAAQRAYWHVLRSTLGSAQAVAGETGPSRRPRSLAPVPSSSTTCPPNIWFDEEGKPHYTVLAIEIDIEGSDAENDRLLAFLIYLKSNVVSVEDNPLSLDD